MGLICVPIRVCVDSGLFVRHRRAMVTGCLFGLGEGRVRVSGLELLQVWKGRVRRTFGSLRCWQGRATGDPESKY